MEENPLHSKDLMHGVPPLFKELLNEIIEQVDALQNNPIAPVQVLDIDDEDFQKGD
jgi:hypothetical protein